ncbi:MAG: hypothetical protein GY816_07870 [Cytophagales bacterium]|nr:hypothetical protein [Cytophagales bacterium]
MMNRLNIVIKYIFLFILFCSCEKEKGSNQELTLSGSISRFEEVQRDNEIFLFAYFLTKEAAFLDSAGVSKANMVEYIQNLIDDNHLPTPYVLLGDSLFQRQMSYAQYLEFRTMNPLDSNKMKEMMKSSDFLWKVKRQDYQYVDE